MRLQDRVAVITGAGSGIGKCLALGLAQEGAAVAAVDLDADSAFTTATEIIDAGGRAIAVTVDVSELASVQSMVQRVLDNYATIDILVNNAGIVSHSPLLQISQEEWDRVLATNLKSVLLCVQAIAPVMIENNRGAIVNISSVAADLPTPNYAPYGASKAGILQLTKSIALELARHNIRVNAIQPGTVYTPMNQEALADPQVLAQRLQTIPLGFIGSVEDVLAAATFLLSEDARYITGTSLVVDGGSILVR